MIDTDEIEYHKGFSSALNFEQPQHINVITVEKVVSQENLAQLKTLQKTFRIMCREKCIHQAQDEFYHSGEQIRIYRYSSDSKLVDSSQLQESILGDAENFFTDLEIASTYMPDGQLPKIEGCFLSFKVKEKPYFEHNETI